MLAKAFPVMRAASAVSRRAPLARPGVAVSPSPMRQYHERVIDHYNNPRNVGKFAKEELKDVGTGLVGAPACGDVMKLQLKIVDDVVVDAKFKTFGCGSAIASSSLATEWVKGIPIPSLLGPSFAFLSLCPAPLSSGISINLFFYLFIFLFGGAWGR